MGNALVSHISVTLKVVSWFAERLLNVNHTGTEYGVPLPLRIVHIAWCSSAISCEYSDLLVSKVKQFFKDVGLQSLSEFPFVGY